LRIAYISIGGHIHTNRWLSYFKRKGHEVHLITSQPHDDPDIEVYDLASSMPIRALHYAYGLLRLKRILRRIRPDLLHVHFLTGYGYWGAFSGFHPTVLTVWGDDVYFTPKTSFLKNKLARYALRKADVVTGDSKDIIEESIRMGAPEDKAYVIQWGVELDKFSPGVASTVRDELSIAPEQPFILSTRSFTQAYYNIDIILEAMPRVLKAFPDAVLVVAGNEGDDAEFRKYAERVGVLEHSCFVGRIPHEKLPEYLVAADAFITVPSVDATAVSLLEAMACETPVVASDLASNREWIFDHESGLIVEPRDVEGLSEAIIQYLSSKELRGRVGKRARGIVKENADHETNMKRMEEICLQLVEEYKKK
jgi:glycosyltransferase involved in cell wall biosynthesis